MKNAWRRIPEYDSVVRRATADGWLDQLLEAHATPIFRETAHQIIFGERFRLPTNLREQWRDRKFRGRAGYRAGRGYHISLPTIPGGRSCYLRAGLVLHEIAHVWDHQQRRKWGHGPEFCIQLQRALNTILWRRFMPTSSLKTIYDAHRGPFSLQIVREIGTKKSKQSSDHVDGPFTAEEAHEEARLLVKDAKENVTEVFVFSITEGQFIGAFYKRGEAHRPWHEEVEQSERVELPDQRVETALLSGGTEPLREVDDPLLPGLPAVPVPSPGPVRDVPAEKPARQRTKPARKPGDRFPVVRGRALTLGHTEGWPESAPAQAVREFFGGFNGRPLIRATVAEVIQLIGPRLNELGMAHPGSLVSRLKQRGLLKEVIE